MVSLWKHDAQDMYCDVFLVQGCVFPVFDLKHFKIQCEYKIDIFLIDY